jgi:hypothetical protein
MATEADPMMYRSTNHRTCLIGLSMVAALAVPRVAGACSGYSFYEGLTVKPYTDGERRIAADGVLAFDAFINGATPEEALAQFSLTLTPEGGGPAIAGEVSHRTIATAPLSEVSDYQEIVLVWRPAAPPQPGTYQADVIAPGEIGIDEWSFPVVVEAAAAAPLAPPRVETARAISTDGETLEAVCCETGQSSCGDHSYCEPTRVRVVPGFTITATLEPADVERALLWVAPWDGQAPGVPYERMNAWFSRPEDVPWWAEWTDRHDILLPELSGEHCIVIGATSLIDGGTAISAPYCGELTAAYEESRALDLEPEGDPYTGFNECLGPPVYEHDGSPYPREAEGGCRLANDGPGWLVWLVPLALRRRRAR